MVDAFSSWDADVGARWRAVRGVGLILDDRAHAGCGGATNAPPGRGRPAGADAGGDGEAAGRPATETGRERTAPPGEPEAELLVAGGDCGGERATWPITTEPGGDVR